MPKITLSAAKAGNVSPKSFSLIRERLTINCYCSLFSEFIFSVSFLSHPVFVYFAHEVFCTFWPIYCLSQNLLEK